MRPIFTLPHVRAIAVIVIGLFGIGALVAENPSVVRAATQLISNTCSTAATCYQWTNTGTGAAIRGAADGASGVVGATSASSGGKAGVFGSDLTNNSSIATNDGVHGITNFGSGVVGDNNGTHGIGVNGNSASGSGVFGFSTNYIGVFALSGGADQGLYAQNTGTGIGVEAVSATNNAVYASADGSLPAVRVIGDGSGDGIDISINGIPGGPGQAIYGYNSASGGRGTDFTGQYIGIIGRAPASTGAYPLVLTDTSANDVFQVDGVGDVAYHGTLTSFVRTADSRTAHAYGSKTTSPTVEDNGTAQLVNGSAIVMLDPTFASMMDPRTVYHVMLTPDGDTRGLYVASKSARYFVVREVQGGHATLSFDYHIYGAEMGSVGMRASIVNPAMEGPRARLTPREAPHIAKAVSPWHH
jgi:hypothetical protein